MSDVREVIRMNNVKADDMDSIGQIGAANLLHMNVDTLETLLARNKVLEAVCKAADDYCVHARSELIVGLVEHTKYKDLTNAVDAAHKGNTNPSDDTGEQT